MSSHALSPTFSQEHNTLKEKNSKWPKATVSETITTEAPSLSSGKPEHADAQLTIISAPFASGQGKPGADLGPAALLATSLLSHLSSSHQICQAQCTPQSTVRSDLPVRNMLNPRTVSTYTRELATQTYASASSISRSHITLTLGGDHSVAIGSVAGIAKAVFERTGLKLGLIWVDAHADINTPEMTGSGNIHGTPMAWLTGLARSNDERVFGWIEELHRVDVSRIVYIGLRDVEEGEESLLRKHKIKAYRMRDVERLGIPTILSQTLAYLGHSSPLHLSFDIDALDPAYAPSTGTPVPHGLSLNQGRQIAETIGRTGRMAGMDLVEVNPLLDVEGSERTIQAGRAIVEAALRT